MAAGVHWPLATYYFGTKEQLFDEVIGRRAAQLTQTRLETLATISQVTRSGPERVRKLIEGYVSPLIQARYGRSAQWQAHVRLTAALVNIKRWAPLVRKHFDQCAQAYLEALRSSLPGVDNNALLNAFSFMIAITLYTCSYTNRFSRWKTKSLSRKAELAAVAEDLIRFAYAGFMDLAKDRSKIRHASKAANSI